MTARLLAKYGIIFFGLQLHFTRTSIFYVLSSLNQSAPNGENENLLNVTAYLTSETTGRDVSHVGKHRATLSSAPLDRQNLNLNLKILVHI